MDQIKKFSSLNLTQGSEIAIGSQKRSINKQGTAKIYYVVELSFN